MLVYRVKAGRLWFVKISPRHVCRYGSMGIAGARVVPRGAPWGLTDEGVAEGGAVISRRLR